jgi:hypothetical protein
MLQPLQLRQRADGLVLTTWGLLLAVVLTAPFFSRSPTLGDDLTRYTVRLALLYYAIAVALMLRLRPAEWVATEGRGRFARWCWSLGWATYLVHLGMAFHFYHGWSHRNAVAHVEQVSRFGPGIFFSHLFTLLWTLDVLWWRLRPDTYARRLSWIGWMLHGFMASIIFCATVIYEEGFIRWAGVVLFAVVGILLVLRWTDWQSALRGTGRWSFD